MSLRDDILAGGFDLAHRDDGAIALALSADRTKVVSRSISDGTIAAELGIGGMLFLLDLEEAAARTLTGAETQQQRVTAAAARQAWRSLAKGELDIGTPSVRALISGFVGVLIDETTCNTLLGLAVVSDPVSVDAVSKVINDIQGIAT